MKVEGAFKVISALAIAGSSNDEQRLQAFESIAAIAEALQLIEQMHAARKVCDALREFDGSQLRLFNNSTGGMS